MPVIVSSMNTILNNACVKCPAMFTFIKYHTNFRIMVLCLQLYRITFRIYDIHVDQNALEMGDALVGVTCKLAHILLISPHFECSVGYVGCSVIV